MFNNYELSIIFNSFNKYKDSSSYYYNFKLEFIGDIL